MTLLKSSDELEKKIAEEEDESEAPFTQRRSCLFTACVRGYEDRGDGCPDIFCLEDE